MARFLSAAWVDECNAALDGVVLPTPGPEAGLAAADGRFAVAQEVLGTPEGDVRLLMTAADGRVRFDLGPIDEDPLDDEAGTGPAPDVTIVVSYDDAAAMSTGGLTPAEALNGGRIKVRGDLSVLVAGQTMVDAARRRIDGLDSATTY